MKHIRSLNPYIRRYKWLLLIGICFVVVANIFAIYPAQVIREVFDVVSDKIIRYRQMEGFELQEGFYSGITGKLLMFGALILLMALIKGLFTFMMRQTIIIMSRHIEYDLKNVLFAHYQKLTQQFYRRNNTGDLMNRISEDVSRVRMYLGPAIMYTVNLCAMFIMVVGVMLSVNAKLTLFVLTPLPVMSILIYFVSNKINKRSEAVQQQLSQLSTISQEDFSGIRVLKSFTMEERAMRRFADACKEYMKRSLGLVSVNATFFPIILLLIGLSTTLTVYVGGILSMQHKISTGNIAEFVIYVNMLTWPFASVGWVTSLVQRASASMKRINEFLETQPEINAASTRKVNTIDDLTFKNVSFIYPDTGIKALDDVSFSVKKGQTLAIVGSTGAGKTTVAALMLRLFDVSSGAILIDGIDLRETELRSYRNCIGYVPQDHFLFSDTVGENIRFGAVDRVSNEALFESARLSAIHKSITTFPDAYDTHIGERGITLSGGQKQRLSIARALIRDPLVLILDDSLSAVDTATENEILKNLGALRRNKTNIIISHRVSSVKDADHIIVLAEHRIAEEGRHQFLLDKKGIYYDMFHRQEIEAAKSIDKKY